MKKQRNNCLEPYQFKPGHCANPKGRPKKGQSIAEILREIGQQKKNGRTKMEIILEKAFERAMVGYTPALDFIADRIEGKAPQTIKNITEQEIRFGEYKKELSTKTIDELISEINRSFIPAKKDSV